MVQGTDKGRVLVNTVRYARCDVHTAVFTKIQVTNGC